MFKTPASLLERLRGPFEPQAWAHFVSLYTPLIYSWARRVGLQEPDAADLVQDVFVTLLQVMPTFTYNRSQSFRRWLQTVTLNKWRKTWKHPANRRVGEQLQNLEDVPANDGLEQFWEEEYRRHVVGQAMRLMQTDFAETTWKACLEVVVSQRRAAEVAAEFGMTVKAVYEAKFRVLNRLRRDLGGLLD